jgi:hypothetical protein
MKERVDQSLFVSDATDGQVELEVKFLQVTGDEVSQFHMLQRLPQPFDRVQVRCITRQPLQADLGAVIRREL